MGKCAVGKENGSTLGFEPWLCPNLGQVPERLRASIAASECRLLGGFDEMMHIKGSLLCLLPRPDAWLPCCCFYRKPVCLGV